MKNDNVLVKSISDKSYFRGKVKNILLNLSLLIVSILVVCFLIEAGLRLWIPKSNVKLFEYSSETNLYKVMKPNIRGVVYGIPFETNNIGFRDKEDWVQEKRKNEFRIIVLGDSYTASAGVAFENIYTQLLENFLQSRNPTHYAINVMNLGVGGYNIVHYNYVLTEIALTLKPDYIIVGVFPTNDLNIRDYYTHRRIALGLEKPRRRDGIESLYIYRAFGWNLLFVYKYIQGKLSFSFRKNHHKTDLKLDTEGWLRNIEALKSTSKIAKKEGIPFLVFLLPQASKFFNQKKRHDKIRGLCEQMGIECIDMLNEFIKSGIPPQKLRLNIIDSHPNEKYHKIVASRLTEYMSTRLQD